MRLCAVIRLSLLSRSDLDLRGMNERAVTAVRLSDWVANLWADTPFFGWIEGKRNRR
jgi:hypothetical protein